MKQIRLLAATLLTGLALNACSKKSDPTASPTPSYKQHTLKIDYANLGLSKATVNLGAGIHVVVDKKAVPIASAIDTIYYVSSQDATALLTLPRTLTVAGATLTLEVGFYNVYGTRTQPKDRNGNNITLPIQAILNAQPTIDGTALPASITTITGDAVSGGLVYENGRNPTKKVSIDLTKL
jgi:hypothetical protein